MGLIWKTGSPKKRAVKILPLAGSNPRPFDPFAMDKTPTHTCTYPQLQLRQGTFMSAAHVHRLHHKLLQKCILLTKNSNLPEDGGGTG